LISPQKPEARTTDSSLPIFVEGVPRDSLRKIPSKRLAIKETEITTGNDDFLQQLRRFVKKIVYLSFIFLPFVRHDNLVDGQHTLPRIVGIAVIA
jgi:hypothetical protein